MHDLLEAIVFLKTHDFHGASIIRGYHVRSVAPLMARVFPLYRTTLTQVSLRFHEVAQRLKEATGDADTMFSTPGASCDAARHGLH